jgi:LmbE family N-acetylglucosaminyl deacetylase
MPRLIERIAEAKRGRIDARRSAVIVAHPDDETIGCGALLARLDGVQVIVVTDGAPANGIDARTHGFADIDAYAAARARELDLALSLAGVASSNIRRLGLADQGAAHALPRLTRTLASLIDALGLAAILTHAFEGGHPDHDAVAFAVAAAVERLERPVEVVEMPFYHRAGDDMVLQHFADVGPCEVTLPLGEAERALKARMLAAHATQAATLTPFSTAFERFRPARPRNFRALPNGGAVLYADRDWGLDARLWPVMAARALDDLKQPGTIAEADAWA